jgi:YebC/PmpR family DNA-binding regulatory protein
MSGHSKWSQIKRQKGAADVKRGATFSKLTNAIIVAAKNGGDPGSNFTLKMAIEKARSANMPKENIERSIKRGTGEEAGAQIAEVLYEAIGPGGVGIMIEAATDNKNRTTSTMKNILTTYGAKLASTGAVAYQFTKMGKLLVDAAGKDKEALELQIIDAGAEDFEDQDDAIAVYTKPNELEIVKRAIEKQGLSIKEATLSWEPKSLVQISEKQDASRILQLMEAIENMEEVTAVHANFDIEGGLINENIGN